MKTSLSEVEADADCRGYFVAGYLPPRQHNRYESGDLSRQLVNYFGLPIYKVVTRSMSMRSSQASDF